MSESLTRKINPVPIMQNRSSAPQSAKQPSANPAQDAPVTRQDQILRGASRSPRLVWDIAGIMLIALSIMTLLALPGLTSLTGGRALDAWAEFLRGWLGYGSYILAISLGFIGLHLLRQGRNKTSQIPWSRIYALELAAFIVIALMALISGASLESAEAGQGGGRIGWGLVELMRLIFQSVGFSSAVWLYLVFIIALLVILFFGLGLTYPLVAWLEKHSQASTSQPVKTTGAEPTVSMSPLGEPEKLISAGSEAHRKRSQLPAEFRKRLHLQPNESASVPAPPRNDRLPPLELLVNEQSFRPDERNINTTAGLIEKTLADFGIPAKVIGFRVGPTVTQFAVEPGYLEKGLGEDDAIKQKVRVAQISSLSRDLALALSAERLRIEAPVPGRPYVGIEVPNSRSSIVRLRPILESEVFYKTNTPLAIALGRDVSGQPIVADLETMPHLLIAGTTGSGKSVCIAALTTCLVMNNTPDDLRLVMIDPKMVELVRFNGLPHLYGKVETDLQRILGVLQWTVTEMDQRYRLLEEMHARNIDSYNRKMRRRKGGQPLPRIVVMIDELADLMMAAPEQTEPALVRLAQMARATGIHLVLATQRPSTDVVTGVIKANFPARISFAVASSVDSRVILDVTGAESLLGHGDMLFVPPEASGPVRLQGVMVTDQEVEKAITFWQQAHPSVEGETPPWEKMLEEQAVLADRDNLITRAIEIVRETHRASASLLQRRLHIGYPRAARLMDELEELGIIGPAVGGGREREVLDEAEESSEETRKNAETDTEWERET